MNISKVIIISVFCCYSLSSAGQKFSVGMKAGVLATYTNYVDTGDSLKSGIKPGFSFGGIVGFPMKKNYTFQVEAGYSKQGRVWKYTPNSDQWSSTYNFIDLSMALKKSFRLKIKENISSNWFFTIGPNVNYWLSGKGKMVPYFGIHQKYSMVFDQKPNYSYTQIHINEENRWLFGLNFGIGWHFITLKNQKIFTELRLTLGQTYLGKRHSETLGGTPSISDEMSLKCNLKTLNFSVGYIFDRDLQKGKMGKSTKKLK
ncbi:MAG TPA: hypothetical protein DGG95_10600 [Cytophagales bacterium]|jgi:hypothetical protein|nr:hypothetical protein [Cytophagales bacterium]